LNQDSEVEVEAGAVVEVADDGELVVESLVDDDLEESDALPAEDAVLRVP